MTKDNTGLTQDDVERILRLIDESGYDEVRIEYGELKVHVRRHGAANEAPPPPAQVPAPAAPAAVSAPRESAAQPAARKAADANAIPEGLVAIRAPMLGTFYRAPSPGAAPFAEEGAVISADAPVCIIEVMKLFNTLKAGTAGKVVRFLVENGEMVEFDQPLILIEPRAAG